MGSGVRVVSNLFRRRLGFRILGGFGIASLLAFLVATGSLLYINSVRGQTTHEAQRSWEVGREILNLRLAVIRETQSAQSYVLATDPAAAAAYRLDMSEAQHQYQASYARLSALQDDQLEMQALKNVDAQYSAFSGAITAQLTRDDPTASPTDISDWLNASRAATDGLLTSIDNYAQIQEGLLLDRVNAAAARTSGVMAVAAAISAVAALIGLALGAVITSQVTARIRRVNDAANQIARFDFSSQLPPMGEDELGQLALAINQMATKLHEGQTRIEFTVQRLAIINEAATHISASLELADVLKTILAELRRVLDFHRAAVFLIDTGQPRRVAGVGWSDEQDADLARQEQRVASSLVVLQLVSRGATIGRLTVAPRQESPLTSDDELALHLFASHAAAAIDNALLYQQSRQVGITEERNRLAREIHDTLAQGLTAIAMQLETANAMLEHARGESTKLARNHVRRAAQLARQNLDEARRSVLDLRAAPLEGHDLRTALETLAGDESEKAGVVIRCTTAGEIDRYPARIEAGLYRIAQEALANAIRHAHPSSIELCIARLADTLRLTVTDDGDGFDTSAPRRGTARGGFGLTGMRERAALLGGTLQVESAPGQGTEVLVEVPAPIKTSRRLPAERTA